jgi:hypothetical protein
VVILLSLVFWFSVWGGIGAVLAVPIMCAVRISLEEIPHRGTHALARMMAPVSTSRSPLGFDGDVSDTASDVTGGDGLDTDGSRRRMDRRGRYGGRREDDESNAMNQSPPRGWLMWAYDSVMRSELFSSNRGHDRGQVHAARGVDTDDEGVVEGPREPLLPPSRPPPRAPAPGLGSTM